MAQITPELIRQLRERTGIGVGKCKEALEEAKGNIELAIENLRKAGMAAAVKKAAREAKEGMICVGESDKAIAFVEVNVETDFVLRNERFQNFLETIADEIAKTAPESLEVFAQQPFTRDRGMTIDQYRSTIVHAIGENIIIRRLKVIPKKKDATYGIYTHLGGKIATAAEIKGSADEQSLAKDIAMHIAAASPDYLSPEQVPQDVIEQERDIARTQMQGKPANVIEKILEGKLNAFYDQNCLIRQKYIKNDQIAIQDLVKQRAKETGKPLELAGFVRWAIGQ